MSRIRTFKPEFFRHELLQDLEIENPGKYPMMVFEALWGHCDKNGSFEWRPKILKLDILPFLPFSMEETLKILENAKMVIKYTVDGVDYGFIPTFKKHQRIGGSEAENAAKYPQYINNLKDKNKKIKKESPEKQQGSNEEALGQHLGLQEGKGREREQEGKGMEKADSTVLTVSSNPPKKNLKKHTDQEFFESLKTNTAYSHIDIDREWGKCQAWCELRQKIPTRQRFVNWLNRCDQFLGPAPPGGVKSLPSWVERREREMRQGAGGGNVST